MTDTIERAGQQEEPEEHGPWPSWESDGNDGTSFRKLARYASVAAMQRLGLFLHGITAEENGQERLRLLYERLRQKSIPYNTAPLNSGLSQRIRDPEWVDRDSGTCLDLSLMFVTMCMEAGLRPYLCLRTGGETQHAFVLVRTDPANAGARYVLPPVSYRPTRTPNVYQLSDGKQLGPEGIAIDVTLACRDQDKSFQEACERGSREIERGRGTTYLVDIAGAQTHPELTPYSWVRAKARPAIGRRLPPRPAFTPFASRVGFFAELKQRADKGGLVVLYGAPGMGKSLLAHQLAARADDGCGWFLDAYDTRTLNASLGEAELDEKGETKRELGQGAVREGFADLARQRLLGSSAPWVVVADNVNVGPSQIVLPQGGSARQLVVVTTTERAWADLPETLVLEGLEDPDVTGLLGGDAPIDALAGRPLLVAASARFRATVGHHWWQDRATRPTDPEEAPALLWAAAKPRLTSVELCTAIALAWLPPVPLAPELLAVGLYGPADEPDAQYRTELTAVRDAVSRLERLGLADSTEGRAAMHRLFRSAVRDDMTATDSKAVAAVGELYGNLLAALDRLPDGPQGEGTPQVFLQDLLLDPVEDVRPIRDLLNSASPGDEAAAALHALGRVVERQDAPTAAAIFAEAETALEGQDEDTWPAAKRLMLSDCLRGKAREVLRNKMSSLGTPEQAIEWCRRAIRLCVMPGAAAPAGRAARLATSRAEAMLGLLLRGRARSGLPREEQLKQLRVAGRILERSAAERVALAGADSPDVDRSRFNLGGLEIRLARVDHGVPPAEHLAQARRYYSEVLRIRERRYRTRELEEVVCCVHGLALVGFYSALLLEVPTGERVRLLREAAEHAAEAERIRRVLGARAESEDSTDTVKSLNLATKITLLRLDVQQGMKPPAPTTAPGLRASEGIVAEYQDEYRDAYHRRTGGEDPAPQDKESR
ncbi:hypothetical protein ACEZDB_10235 [Streptacidiphilus sp. N1-3]|uniref:AAA+ ATPase domain-containing protein n=1 Tax=Streptacidiphilus alkalitolerans TaxID=3342712 RepID=A0ABV6WYC8_9ACTN